MKSVIKSCCLMTTLALSCSFTSIANAATVWANDSSGRLGTINTDTQEVNIIGTMNTTMTDIAFDPNGNLWGISFSNLYSIDKNTANSTLVGSLGTTANSLAFGADGTLYTANSSLYTVDTTTGAASLVGNGQDSYSSSGDLAFVNDTLYLSATQGDRLFSIDTSNGNGTEIGDIDFSLVYGLAGTSDTLFGLSGTALLSIDLATGLGTELFDFAGEGFSGNYGATIAPVPVPAALWLFGSALFGLFAMRSKKIKTIAA